MPPLVAWSGRAGRRLLQRRVGRGIRGPGRKRHESEDIHRPGETGFAGLIFLLWRELFTDGGRPSLSICGVAVPWQGSRPEAHVSSATGRSEVAQLRCVSLHMGRLGLITAWVGRHDHHGKVGGMGWGGWCRSLVRTQSSFILCTELIAAISGVWLAMRSKRRTFDRDQIAELGMSD